MLHFNWAQTFWLDRTAVQNATEVAFTRIDLYFRAKPPAENNKSGIYKPGVEVKLVPCINGKPVISQMGAFRPTEPMEHGAKMQFYSAGQTARVEYDEILASGNASVPTTFLFPQPIFVPTNNEYAIVIQFDGSENFVLWTTVVGDILVGTTSEVSKGPSGNFHGTLFSFIDNPTSPATLISNTTYAYSNTTLTANTLTGPAMVYGATSSPDTGWDTSYLMANWNPLVNETLKINIHVARYWVNSFPIVSLPEFTGNNVLTSANNRIVLTMNTESVAANGFMTLPAPCQTTEYITFDMSASVRGNLHYGMMYYQDCPAWPNNLSPLTVTIGAAVQGSNSTTQAFYIQANSSYLLPGNVSFSATGGFNNLLSPGSYIILEDVINSLSMPRQVTSIVSNTIIMVNHPFDATSSGARIRVPPVGFLNEISTTTVHGEVRDLVTLYNSMVNSTVRFVSHTIANSTVNSGGTGYSNNDYIKIIGFEDINYSVKGNYAALANIVTNSSGVITGVYLANGGCGFVNTSLLHGANVIFYQSSGGVVSLTPSAGSGANITFGVGSVVKSALSGAQFANCEVVNMEVSRMKPEMAVNNPLGASYAIRHRTLYYSIKDANTHSGRAYYVDTPEETANTDTLSKIFKAHTLDLPDVGKAPLLTSRSNDFVIRYANGAVNSANTWGTPYSNAAVFFFDVASNSDFQVVWVDPEAIMSHYSKYIINEEYTNDHTNYGASVAKHVATKINLASNAFAEDVVVYLNAYRPSNSELKVYARLHNSADSDAFDDTEFSLLELVDGVGMYSSSLDDSNYVELTYNLPAYPNTDFTLDGSVTLYQGNLNVTGNTTIFGPRTTISGGGTGYGNGDVITFTAPNNVYTSNGNIFAYKRGVGAKYMANTAVGGAITTLTRIDVGYGWDSQANVTTFTVANSTGGNSAGSGATLVFNPGLQANDLIKIYSPYTDWANTNYTLAVVDTITSNTSLKVRRTFGELSANLVGNVSINTTSTTLDGVDTTFTTHFSVGDFIAVWANSSVYEVKKITAITDANTLIMESNGTFVNTATFYAKVEADNFMNTSTSVSNLRVDRLAYPHQAFNNIQNDNVARYYNSSMMEFDAYDTLQIKVVLLSDDDTIIPKVDDIRGVCVTA